MAFPPLRSMNSELSEGMTDGKYKKVVQNRGGAIDAMTYQERSDLYDTWHGIHESALKHRPDGKMVHTPNYVATPPALIEP